MEKRFLTIKEASKYLGVTPLTLRNWDNSGKLHASRHPINNYRLYNKLELDAVMRKIEIGAEKKTTRKQLNTRVHVLKVKHLKD